MSFQPLPQVRDDVESAATWYDAQRPGLGDEFVEAAEEAAEVVGQSPRAFGYARPAIPGREVRRYNMPRFPYAVFYEVIGQDHALLLAIHHARRRPVSWRSRLPKS